MLGILPVVASRGVEIGSEGKAGFADAQDEDVLFVGGLHGVARREGLAALELIALEDDPRAQRRLEQRGIGRGDAAPAEGVRVGRERPRLIRRMARLQRRAPRGEDACVRLGVPDHVEPLPLGVVVHARELNDGGGAGRGPHVLHEVGPPADANEAAGGERRGVGEHGGGRIRGREPPGKLHVRGGSRHAAG